jgi:hypothetical protein
VDGCCSKSGDDRCESGIVVELPTFLLMVKSRAKIGLGLLTSATKTKCLMTTTRFLTSNWVNIISATQLVNWLECRIRALTFGAGSGSPSPTFFCHVLFRHSVGLIFAVKLRFHDGQLACEFGDIDVQELELLHVLRHDGHWSSLTKSQD